MNTNDSRKVCPKCGAPVPVDAPQGLCPKCVLAGAASVPPPDVSATATGEIPSLARVAAAFPQLEVLELIGRGGMGFVFKARQPHLDRFVALKLLPDKLALDPHFAERFNREGRVLARLNHPNIVSVFDFGRTEHFYFLTMEYVDGVNLRQAMQAGRFSPSEALSIVPKICEALQCAHEQGVLHRDIKPENILLDAKGHVKIADFGIAKLVGEDQPSVTLTGTGAALGTPHYMAPEQLEKPGSVDHRADIYSLGVVFYEMLTGELPIGRFAPPSAKTPVDSSVDDVVFRALEKDRDKRYQSAGQVKTEVEHLAGTPLPPTVVATKPAKQSKVWVSTLKHTWSWLGQHHARLRGGRLSLWPDRLEFVSRGDGRSIPLRNVTGLSLVEAPRHCFFRRANRLALACQEGPEEQVFEFDFKSNPFVSRRAAEARAREWRDALANQVAVLTGQAPTPDATDRAFASVYPDGGTRRLWGGLELSFYVVVFLFLLAENLLASLGLVVGAIVIGRLMTAWRRQALLLRPWGQRAGGVGPHGTRVLSNTPRFSRLAIWGAVLTGLGLVLLGGPVALVFIAGGGLGTAALLLLGVPGALCALAGTILGWMGLVEIQGGRGALRGLPLALFAALTWPLLVLVVGVLVVPSLVLVPSGETGASVIVGRILLLLVPAGVLTFAVWAIYSTARWASGQPLPQRRGVLKWIFAGLLVCGMGIVLVSTPSGGRSNAERPAPIEESRAAREAAAPLPAGVVERAAVPQTSEIRVNLRVAKGSVATLQLMRRDTEPPAPVPFLDGYVLAPDDERGRCEFVLSPTSGRPQLTNPPSWTMSLVTVDGTTVRSISAELGPLIPRGTTSGLRNTLDIGPDTDTELLLAAESASENTNGIAPRVPLSLTLRVRGHDRRAASRQPIANTGVSIGSTNWGQFLAQRTVEKPSPRPQPGELLAHQWLESPAGTNTTNWIRFTFTNVELRNEKGQQWLALDYATDKRGNCEEVFRVDGAGFKATTRKSDLRVTPKGSPPVQHRRVEWLVPPGVQEDTLRDFRDAVAESLLAKSFLIPEGEQRPLLRGAVGTIGHLAIAVGARLRSPAPAAGASPE